MDLNIDLVLNCHEGNFSQRIVRQSFACLDQILTVTWLIAYERSYLEYILTRRSIQTRELNTRIHTN